MCIEKIKLSRVDLHEWIFFGFEEDVDLFAGRATEDAGSSARKGGSDASAFRALSIHSPEVLWLLERTILSIQYTAWDSSRRMINVSTGSKMQVSITVALRKQLQL